MSSPPPDVSITPGGTAPGMRTRPLDETPALAKRAADLLATPQAIVSLSPDEARTVVQYMRLVSFPAGTTLFREGDDSASSYMLLLLEGEVGVDTGPEADGVNISVVGPGSLLGEMALLDGAPRSASCTAMAAVRAAGLSRRGLEILLDEHPRVAAHLMVGVSQRIAERLRGLSQQIRIYADIAAQLKAQLGEGRRS